MKLQSVTAALLAVGVTSLLASPILSSWDLGMRGWTEQDAKRLQTASHQYHAALLSSVHAPHTAEDASPHDTSLKNNAAENDAMEDAAADEWLPEDQLVASRAEYVRQSERLKLARSQGDRFAWWLWQLGIIACAIGIALGIVHRFLPDQKKPRRK